MLHPELFKWCFLKQACFQKQLLSLITFPLTHYIQTQGPNTLTNAPHRWYLKRRLICCEVMLLGKDGDVRKGGMEEGASEGWKRPVVVLQLHGLHVLSCWLPEKPRRSPYEFIIRLFQLRHTQWTQSKTLIFSHPASISMKSLPCLRFEFCATLQNVTFQGELLRWKKYSSSHSLSDMSSLLFLSSLLL